MSGLPVWCRRYRMEFDLDRLGAPPAVPAGFRLVAWREELLAAHAWAKFQGFRDAADSAIFPGLGTEEGCLRLVRDISGREGFLAGGTWLVIQEESPDCRLLPVGTIQALHTEPWTGAIQNVAVIPSARGRGLGSLLVGQSLFGMRESGLRWGTLEVTVRNVGAVRLYERLGFRIRQIVYKPGRLPSQ